MRLFIVNSEKILKRFYINKSSRFWIVTNKKSSDRKGKIQLIDGSCNFDILKKKLGDKRKEITEESLNKGIFLLFSYSLGLAIPFILSGYLIQKFLIFSKNFKKNISLVSKVGGIILLITGILILTNQLQALGYYLLEIFPFLQNFG